VATRARSAAALWGGLSEGATVLVDTAPWIYPKSGSYPVVGKPDVGFGGPMMGAMRSLM
jgi:hypothetical protein